MRPSNELTTIQEKLKETIINHIQTFELEIAKSIITEYEKINAVDYSIYCFKGIIAHMERDLLSAIECYKQGIKLNPTDVDLHYNLGCVYVENGQKALAYREFDKVIKLTNDETIQSEAKEKIGELGEIELLAAASSKRVLIVAHIFPPVGGSGVQRTLKFVKYLQGNGWEPIVVTVGKTQYPLTDSTLLKEVPDNIEIIRVDEPELQPDQDEIAQLFQLYSNVVNRKEVMDEFLESIDNYADNYLLPDAYVLWAMKAIKQIKEQYGYDDFDLIYTTSGPYSDHIIGYELKKHFNKPWIADFRDEWTNNPYACYEKDDPKYKMELAMEQELVRTADHVITTTPLATQNYIDIFDVCPSKISTITNGYDEEDFENLPSNTRASEKMKIFHNGLLYSIRTPQTFFEALSELVNSNQIPRDKIEVGFAWTEDEEIWRAYAAVLGLEEIVQFHGYMTHEESLLHAYEADVLLLLVGAGDKNKAMYPGKIFEYLRLNKPVLSMSPLGSLSEQLLEQTGRGINTDYNNINGIKESILRLYKMWEGKEYSFEVTEQIEKYERRYLTKQLANIFDTLQHKKEEKVKKKRLCFFSIKDGDKFLYDTIDYLSNIYDVRKVIIQNFDQIQPNMEWADICWFEWCDELLEYGSQLPVAMHKKIICRIHSYEVFTNKPASINWMVVDKLIVVADHLKQILINKVPQIEQQVDIITIPNGVNLKKFKWDNREHGFNIAYVGYMSAKKNPMMLLQIASKLKSIDPRYKIFIAGAFQDEKLEYYWNYQIKELGLEEHVIFTGFQMDMKSWLEDKHILLSTTMHESFGYGIAEAMARGIKPVIHNYVFSKETWPEKYLFNTIDEAVQLIVADEYNSEEYHSFIEGNYSLEKQIDSTMQLLEKLMGEETGDGLIANIKYDDYSVKVCTPNLSDHIQYLLANTRQFYELPMLEDIRRRLPAQSVVVDVGANIGNHSLFFGKICNTQKVYSFEPYLPTYQILEKNIQLNQIEHVVVPYLLALGSSRANANVNVVNDSNMGMNRIVESVDGEILIDTLDSVIYNRTTRIHMIKIDVEGMGIEVLKGAAKIIKRDNPLIYIEAETDKELIEINDLLSPVGYKAIACFNHTPTYLFEYQQ
ncbi:FkbM family methyltransferase [Paenibacillus sp. SC116]|nr:FkbM family methyltransferase [Paenibacillus sp. SC116]